MDDRKKLKNRERIAKQTAKTSDSIRKKYRTLKTGKMEEDDELERHFKPIIEPLKQIVENTIDDEPSRYRLRKCSFRTKKKNTWSRNLSENDRTHHSKILPLR